jgi:hypothetical protein
LGNGEGTGAGATVCALAAAGRTNQARLAVVVKRKVRISPSGWRHKLFATSSYLLHFDAARVYI